MRSAFLPMMLLSAWLAGCMGQSAIKPSEKLDETSGMTVAALQQPIELVENSLDATLIDSRRTSFAYVGPVEWNRMGEISYGLWLHIAPGNDKQVGDIRAPAAVTLRLDDGALVLVPMNPPGEGGGPYKPSVSWGQTSYYEFDVGMLKRMATSQSFTMQLLAPDQSRVDFLPSHDTRTTLSGFAQARGITGD